MLLAPFFLAPRQTGSFLVLLVLTASVPALFQNAFLFPTVPCRLLFSADQLAFSQMLLAPFFLAPRQTGSFLVLLVLTASVPALFQNAFLFPTVPCRLLFSADQLAFSQMLLAPFFLAPRQTGSFLVLFDQQSNKLALSQWFHHLFECRPGGLFAFQIVIWLVSEFLHQ